MSDDNERRRDEQTGEDVSRREVQDDEDVQRRGEQTEHDMQRRSEQTVEMDELVDRWETGAQSRGDSVDDSINRITATVERKQRARRTAIIVTRAAFAVAAAIAVVGLFVALRGAQVQRDEDDERTKCRERLSGRVADAQAVYLLAFGDVLLSLRDGTESDRFNRALGDIQLARQPYANAVDERIGWEQDGAPLPCPR